MNDNENHISNTHIVINSEGEIASSYRKMHLFDMDNKTTGVKLMESDYVLAGQKIEPPISTPIGKLGLSIVSFIQILYCSSLKKNYFYLTNNSAMICVFLSYPFH